MSQLKSDFVSLVSHEFRTPLEIILSSADNLDRYHDRLPAEKREQLLRTIKKSVRRMSGMMARNDLSEPPGREPENSKG